MGGLVVKGLRSFSFVCVLCYKCRGYNRQRERMKEIEIESEYEQTEKEVDRERQSKIKKESEREYRGRDKNAVHRASDAQQRRSDT